MAGLKACATTDGRAKGLRYDRVPPALRSRTACTTAALYKVRLDLQRRVQQTQVAAARDLHRAELLEMFGDPLRVEQQVPTGAQAVDERDERSLRRVARAMEHRLAEERAAKRHAVQP